MLPAYPIIVSVLFFAYSVRFTERPLRSFALSFHFSTFRSVCLTVALFCVTFNYRCPLQKRPIRQHSFAVEAGCFTRHNCSIILHKQYFHILASTFKPHFCLSVALLVLLCFIISAFRRRRALLPLLIHRRKRHNLSLLLEMNKNVRSIIPRRFLIRPRKVLQELHQQNHSLLLRKT